MSDKKSMVPSICIYLVFKKQAQVVPSAPKQVYNHFINKYEKIYMMLTVSLTIWGILEKGGILISYTEDYAYVGEFSFPLFTSHRQNLSSPLSVHLKERTRKSVYNDDLLPPSAK